MPPSDRIDQVRSQLDQSAVLAVRQEASSTILPAPADPASDDLLFEYEAYRYAASWLSAHTNEAADAKPFAIIFSRSITDDEQHLMDRGILGYIKYQAFKSQKMIDVTGCILIATMNLEHVLAVSVQDVTNTQTLLDFITHLGISDRYVAAFEPPHANMILLKPGLALSQARKVENSGSGKPWNLDQLEDKIFKFHTLQTQTPSGVLVPWANAQNGITGDQLEVRISKGLAYDLDRDCSRPGSVLFEVGSSSGRIDVLVTAHALELGCGPCIIEIKVLRSNSKRKKLAPAFVLWWANKGVIQANLYRSGICAPSAYMCAFDARNVDEGMPETETLAGKMNVQFRKYFMYRSTGDLQAAELAKAGA